MIVFTRTGAVKFAVTVVSVVPVDNVHVVPVAEEHPLQPVKLNPIAGVAASVIVALELSPSVQSKPQDMPGPVIVPMPVFATLRVTAVPVPVSGTTVVAVSGSVEGMDKLALSPPSDAGAKTTLMVHEAKGART